MPKIAAMDALEILDSRGNPTLRVRVGLDTGVVAMASVPSGASTGEQEARELRDEDAGRFAGKGVRKAAAHVADLIAPALRGRDPMRQSEIDRVMIELDGTDDKSRVGANAILGVSMAVARAAAQASGLPLYAYLGGPGARRLPVPMMNVINGGVHADNSLDFQEFMLVPHGAASYAEAVRYGAETYHALRRILKERRLTTAVGDEGGFAPNLPDNEAALALIVEAIRAAGLEPGRQVAIALDPAASSFATENGYLLAKSGGGMKTSEQLTQLYATWIGTYPIVSIEDGLGENDWEGFRRHTAALGERVQIVGDDIYVTNTRFIARGIAERTTNAALIKLNQIGTVSETIEAIDLCRRAGWKCVVSHRSGETDDTFMADFAVAMGTGQMKAGAPCRGERVAKYNRLLEIERELGDDVVFSSPFASARQGQEQHRHGQ